MTDNLEQYLDPEQRELLASLTSPARIQAFLDATPYSPEYANRCPLRVLQDRQAHCLDGGLFGAMALRRLGYPPLIVDLVPDPGMDDDHVLAIYRCNGAYGAVAKSNFVGLRYREPVYRTLRELVLSYFDVFFNVNGVKTLRGYTRPFNLAAFDRLDWTCRDEGADAIEKRLVGLHHIALLTPEMVGELSPMDTLTYEANTLGTNPAGLYQPRA